MTLRASGSLTTVPEATLRLARPLPIDPAVVSGCLDLGAEVDRRFSAAWRDSLQALPRSQRGGALASATGHIAESVVELILDERGYVPLAHHPGPGRHGVDLVMLHLPTEMVVAIEVKGTLRAGHVPRLTQGELDQMSPGWVDKADNPGMTGGDLASDDVYGAVAAVNFADMTLRVAMTADFATFAPVLAEDKLDDPSWLIHSD